jgi:hypothetical protein
MLAFSHRFALTVGFGFVAAWHPFCRLHRPRLPLLPSTRAKVRSVWTPENSQPAL